MTAAADQTHDAPSVKATLLSLVALLVLTVATTGIAFLPLEPVAHRLVALGIASAKAAIVAAVFMHLRGESRLDRAFALGGIGWVLVLLAGVTSELLTRG